MNNTTTQQSLLTHDEHKSFYKNGYLVIKDALDHDHISALLSAINKIIDDRTTTHYNTSDILAKDDAFLDLIDIRTVFPKIWGLMGANIWVNHTHFNIVMPEEKQEKVYYGWHVDGGAIHKDIGSKPPLMALKVAFYLNDLDHENSGQTYVIPGSHINETNEIPLTPFEKPPEKSFGLNQKAGTAVIYHPRLIHSLHSPNYSDSNRNAIFIQWAYRWLAPVDPMSVAALKERVTDPIRRQLLGFTSVDGHPRDNRTLPFARQLLSGRYYPREEELPLLEIMENLNWESNTRVWRSQW